MIRRCLIFPRFCKELKLLRVSMVKKNTKNSLVDLDETEVTRIQVLVVTSVELKDEQIRFELMKRKKNEIEHRLIKVK